MRLGNHGEILVGAMTKEAVTRIAPKRRRSRQVTEESLYVVSAELFSACGYTSTTLEHIAKRVGVHKSTIFHYVPSKEALLAAVLDRGLSGYVTSLEEIVARSDDGATRLRAALYNHLDFIFEHRAELRIFLRDRQYLRGAEGEAYVNMSDRYQTLFTRIIADGMRDGSVVKGDATLMGLVLLGAVNSIMEWFRPGGRLTAVQITHEYVQCALTGVTTHQSVSEPCRPGSDEAPDVGAVQADASEDVLGVGAEAGRKPANRRR